MRAEGQEPAAEVPHACVVAVGDAARRKGFALAESLRRSIDGLRVVLAQPSAGFKAQLKRADKSGARYALILGEDEIASGEVGLKDLREDKGQQSLTESGLAEALSTLLSR